MGSQVFQTGFITNDMKNEIKTYMFTALAMAALAIPPAALSGWMEVSQKGYLAALDTCQMVEEKSSTKLEQKKKTESGDEKNPYCMEQDFKKGLKRSLRAFCQKLGYSPSLTEYNLAYLFPVLDTEEEEKETAPYDQNAALLVQKFLQGLSSFGPQIHQKSAGGELFSELNEKEQNWMYRIYQELNNLPYRTGIRFRFLNGDGTDSSSCSNTQEILALTNVYSYFHQWDQVQASEIYAQKLWELSHRYDISIGSVYYCNGCEETDEEEETAFMPSQTEPADGSGENEAEENKASEEQKNGQTVETSANFSAQTSESSSDPTAESGPASDVKALSEQNQVQKPPETLSNTQKSGEETESVSETAEQEEISEKEGSSAQPDSETETAGETVSGNGLNGEAGDFSVCPGHVDVVVTITITGLTEKNNLFSLAASIQETEEEAAASAKNNGGRWKGWTEENQAAVRELAAQDWEIKYKLKPEEMSFGRTLTKQELEAHMAILPESISSQRRKLIACALDSVGKIPYHFGGKASRPGYGENRFFSVTEPDQMGRTLKGLDCSGWINWVYWSALGTPITSGGTSSLSAAGTEISREELKPGDIAVASGDEAHVVMFLGWNPADGKMICIHESAGKVNNVTVSLSDRIWTHYRRILE